MNMPEVRDSVSSSGKRQTEAELFKENTNLAMLQ